MPSPYTIPNFVKGERLTADMLQRLAQPLRQQSLQPGQFQSGAISVQRPMATAGGSNSSSVVLNYGMLVDIIPAYNSINGTDFECEPGILEANDDSDPRTGIVRLKWDDDPESPTFGVKLIPVMKTIETEGDPEEIESRVSAVNVTGGRIRGSADEPVVVYGFEETVRVEVEGEIEEVTRFHIVSVMDHRALMSYVKGVTQVVYHEAGQSEHVLDANECTVAP